MNADSPQSRAIVVFQSGNARIVVERLNATSFEVRYEKRCPAVGLLGRETWEDAPDDLHTGLLTLAEHLFLNSEKELFGDG